MPNRLDVSTPVRVLICGDEIRLAEDLARCLENLGYEIVGRATYAEEALRLVEEFMPDLILMDIKLAGETGGIDAVESVRSRFDIPMVYLTDYSDPDALQRARRTEPHGYVAKPVRTLELRIAIETALHRHETEKRTRVNEAMLAKGEELGDVGSWDWDLQTHEGIVSAQLYRIFGYQPHVVDFNYDLFISAVHPQDREKVEVKLQQTLSADEPYEQVFRIVRPDGTLRVLRARGEASAYNQLHPVRMAGHAQDITDRIMAEDALRESESTLKGILVATPVGLVLTENRMIKWANQEWEKMFGFEDESEYVGHPTSIMYRSEAHYIAARHEIYRNIGNGIFGETFTQFMSRNGTSFHAYLRSTLVDPCDASKGTISAISDVTAIVQAKQAVHESEERYRLLFEDSRDAVFVTTRDGILLTANKAFCDLFGYARNELDSLNARQLYANPADREVFQQAIERTGSTKDFGQRLRKKDSTVFEALVTASVRYGRKREVLGYQGTIRDVTEQRQLEEQLRAAQKMEAVGTLAGGISHDFNNLLQIIHGYGELVFQQMGKADPFRDEIGVIIEAAARGAALVEGILTFSRRTEPALKPVNLNAEIRKAQRLLSRTIPKMIDIQVRLSDELSPINADANQIEQVLLNLASNASDVMPTSGKLLFETENVILDEDYCRKHLEVKPGNYVRMKVSDSGTGMSPDIVARIFEPFYTTKAAGEGTGLGLSVVFGIVKTHGGHIRCESEQGVGTTFVIDIPILEIGSETEESELEEISGKLGTETILLIDDEQLIAELGKRILEKAGYTVLTANSAIEALEVYTQRKSEIALVILDLIMPEMGGEECLKELQRIDPLVKVLIASGFAIEGKTKVFLDSAARGSVAKPFNIGELLATVRRVLDGA